MTDKELQDFIEHGENGFVEFAMVFGDGWAKHAIEIAKESRRLHEVNAELLGIFKRIRHEQGFACECGIEDATWELIEAAIAKATGEQQ